MRHLDLVLLSGEDEDPAGDETGDAIQVMTIHQSKGLEFDAVFVPALVEGRLPQSGRSPRFELPPSVLEPLVRGREDVIAEERRLLYVAMTRARQHLHLVQPLRFFRTHQHRHADGYILSMRSRFIPDGILDLFERHTHSPGTFPSSLQSQSRIRVNVAARMREMWN